MSVYLRVLLYQDRAAILPPHFSAPEHIMSEADKVQSSQDFEGKMFLYSKPALLNKEDHGDMGLSTPERPHDFVKDVKGVPVLTTEIQTAQKYFPVIFSDFDNPVLLAVVGIVEDDNLFVDETGAWERGAYVPSYVRCHPFALATREEDQYAVIIDEESAAVSTDPQTPFFENGEMSPAIQPRLDMCGQFNMEQQRTRDFCQRIKDLGLLNGQRVTQSMSDGSEVQIANYVTIDANKLKDLDKDTLRELHQDGSLAAIYGHLFSLENWNHLIVRRNERLGIS
jgi:hypothetical protein